MKFLHRIDLKRFTFSTSRKSHLCISDHFPIIDRLGTHKLSITYSSPRLSYYLNPSCRFILLVVWNLSGEIVLEQKFQQTGVTLQIPVTKILETANIYLTSGYFSVFSLPSAHDDPSFTHIERGYIFLSSKSSNATAFCHGNKESFSYTKSGLIKPLGHGLTYTNFHTIQHLFDATKKYLLFLTNDTNSQQNFQILSPSEAFATQTLDLTPASSAFLPLCVSKSLVDTFTVSIHSKTLLPRPIVFAYDEKCFDLFHG